MGSHVALNVVKRGIFRTLLGSLLIMSMLTPFGESLDSTLTLHMVVQHFFYLAGGFLLASGADLLVLGASKFSRNLLSIYAWLLKVNASFNRRGMLTFVIAAVLTAYWHVPANFDAALLDDNIHIVMHFTFIVVGGLLFVGSGLLTGRMRHFLVLLPGKAMGDLWGLFAFHNRVCVSGLSSGSADGNRFGYGGYDAVDGFDDRSVLALQILRETTVSVWFCLKVVWF